jgi:putative RecB family exonuclease
MHKVRLSPSRVNDFSNCPQLYKYRAIDQLPEAISLDAERGTLVHSVLESLFDFPPLERTFECAVAIVATKWLEQVEGRPELSELVPNEKEWFDRVEALLVTYFRLESPADFEATFRELHLERDLSEEVYLHGYVDRLDVALTGEVRIVDYKTGRSPKFGWEGKALFQLRVYALMYWRNTGVIPRLLQLIFLGDGQLVKSAPTESELIKTEKKLLSYADDILTAMETDHWPPRTSRLCDWCSFKSICPAYQS